MSGLLAARVAARLRRDLGCDVSLEHGEQGEFTVLVDGAVVMTRSEKPRFAILPAYDRVLSVVREKLAPDVST